mmetsp:Transcript_1941/g.2155  ORF Transcript_1941/g.2155 Transcript_1941/m.2155 type:complete len:489 (+) Transcript_1941:22-1488(+)
MLRGLQTKSLVIANKTLNQLPTAKKSTKVTARSPHSIRIDNGQSQETTSLTPRLAKLKEYSKPQGFGQYTDYNAALEQLNRTDYYYSEQDELLAAHNKVIHASKSSQDAFENFRQMYDNGVSPDVSTFIGLLKHCANSAEAEHVLEEMANTYCVDPDEVVYEYMIGVYRREGNTVKIMRMFDAINENGLVPTMRSYEMKIEALCMGGLPKEGHAVLEEMRRHDFVPSAIAYKFIVLSYATRKLVEPAVRVMSEMKALHQSGDMVDLYHHLIVLSFNNAQYSYVKILYKDMRNAGYVPMIHTYNTLLGTVLKTKSEGDLTAVMDDMKRTKVRPNKRSFNLLLACHSTLNLHEKMPEIATAMVNSGYSPDANTYSQFFNILKKPSDMFNMYDTMKENDVIPQDDIYKTLIDTCRELNLQQKAFGFYSDMIKNNVKGNIDTYNTLLLFCSGLPQERGKAEAHNVLMDMGRDNIKPDSITEWAINHLFRQRD